LSGIISFGIGSVGVNAWHISNRNTTKRKALRNILFTFNVPPASKRFLATNA
jgi:hypothetical protein